VEQVVSKSAVIDEGETVDSSGRRTKARDSRADGADRVDGARVRRGRRRRAGLIGVCRTR
jgi:hypothetical protein